MKSICFVGLDNYPVINPEFGSKYIGGESVQQTLLAKAFANKGWLVQMVVLDLGQKSGEIIDGVNIIKAYKPGAGLPVFRFLHPKLTSINRALKTADADIYYHSCASVDTGHIARFCKRHNKKFIFRLAHDTDCIPGKQLIPYWRDKKIYEYGLKKADIIYAQSDKQVQLLKKNYGLNSHIVNMAVELPNEDLRGDRDIDVLWVNNFRQFKRPELVLKLAEMMPNIQFTMVGGETPSEPGIFQDIKIQARTISNLHLTGFVPYSQVNAYYARAKIFINTSESEGFPNSFLQSWIRGTPVISFFDPDTIIADKKLGFVPQNLPEMVEMIDKCLQNAPLMHTMSNDARSFSLKHFSPASVVQAYEKNFTNLCD